jgi:hypothetical protein
MLLKDEQVITVWKCDECNENTEVNVTFFQDNGTPVCVGCDRDMAYDHTYLNRKNRGDSMTSEQTVEFCDPDLPLGFTLEFLLTNIESLAESIERDGEEYDLTRKEIRTRANYIDFYVCTLRQELLKRGIVID